MLVLKLGAALLGAVLVQMVGVALVPGFAAWLDPFLLVVVWTALRTGGVAGQLTGAVAGLLTDGFTGGLYGLHAFADTLVGYLAALAAQRVVVQQRAVRVALFAAAAAFQQAAAALVLLLLVAEPQLPRPMEVLARVVLTALAGAVLIAAEERLVRSWRGVQEARRRRLRFR